MTETHTATCWNNAGSLVTEELHLQGLWDATYPHVNGVDLVIPAWAGMRGYETVAEVTATWLSDGTVTCRCHEDADRTTPESHAITTTEEPTMTETVTTATTVRFDAVRIDGRWKVQDAATGETVTCASRAKAEERAAKLNAAEECAGSDRPEHRPENLPAAAPLEVVTLDGTETTVLVEETVESYGPDAVVITREYELSPAELAAKVAAEAEDEGRYADAREARCAELAERVNAGEMTFDEAAALLITERGTVPAPAAAEPMKSLWVAAAFVPIILADAAPERATLVAKLDASVPNNRGGRTVRLTRAEAEELAAIGTEIENAAAGVGRNAHSARTMRARLAALWA